MESMRDGARGLTISYWTTREAIDRWRQHPEHQAAQRQGREHWYKSYRVRICEVRERRDAP